VRRILFFFILVMTLSAQVVYPPPTNQIVITNGNNQMTLPNSPFLQPMTVRVLAPDGTPVPGLTVTFTLPPLARGAAGATFPGGAVLTANAITNSEGFAWSPHMTADSPTGMFTGQATIPNAPAAAFRLATGFPLLPGPPAAVPNWLAYSMVIGGAAPAPQTVTVFSNPVNSFTAAANVPWIQLTARGYMFLDVAVDPTGLSAGHYEGLIMVSRDTGVRVRFDILAKPTIDSNLTSLTFTYAAGATTLPLTQSFTLGSSVRNFNIEVNPAYTSPKTGNWLGVASHRGMTLPITLTAVVDPRGLDPGTYLGAIQIIGDATNSPFPITVTLVVTPYQPPANRRIPQIASFANAASFLDGAVSAGQLVRLAGTDLACSSAPAVLVDGDAAQVLSAGDREIRLVVPDSVAHKDRVAVRVTCGDATSDPFTVPVAYAAPALFAVADTQALGYNENLSLNGADTPAPRESVLTLYGTGFGGLDDADQYGVRNFTAPVSVMVAGEPAEVLSAGPATDMPGVVRLRVRVPASAPSGNAVDLSVMSGLEKAQAVRTIAVQ
jgi:uncharacterized protein (TIGR03437 family)